MTLELWAAWLALPHTEVWLDSKGEPYTTTQQNPAHLTTLNGD